MSVLVPFDRVNGLGYDRKRSIRAHNSSVNNRVIDETIINPVVEFAFQTVPFKLRDQKIFEQEWMDGIIHLNDKSMVRNLLDRRVNVCRILSDGLYLINHAIERQMGFFIEFALLILEGLFHPQYLADHESDQGQQGQNNDETYVESTNQKCECMLGESSK